MKIIYVEKIAKDLEKLYGRQNKNIQYYKNLWNIRLQELMDFFSTIMYGSSKVNHVE